VEAAANQSSYAGEEFCQDEWLGEIVVGARVKALDPLLDQSTGGEHHDGGFDALLAQFAANFHTTQAGQPDIQENGVVGDVRTELKRSLASFRDIHGVGIFTQGACDETGDFPFVFDQE
jgi:hypothetical protein